MNRKIKRVLQLPLATLAVTVIASCGGDASPTAPTPTTTPPPTNREVTGLHVTVPGSTTVVDDIVQLNTGESVTITAYASYSDGTEEQVEPAWSSSDPAIAEITQDGTATGVSAGRTELSLRFSDVTGNVTGKVQIEVIQSTFALTGRVTNAVLGGSVSGAVVRILDGPHAGTQTTTNGYGRYELNGLHGGFNFAVSKDGYDEHRQPGGSDRNSVDVALNPNRPETWTQTSYDSGTYDVGNEPGNLVSGLYTIRVSIFDSHCYWERRRNNSADLFERVIRNGNVSEGETFELRILSSDRHFYSDGCSGRLIR
jgi:hypothetical protein